ncbi:MAG: hypothetical protein ACREJC_17430 [Tepidisphaeraceae bacterium]
MKIYSIDGSDRPKWHEEQDGMKRAARLDETQEIPAMGVDSIPRADRSSTMLGLVLWAVWTVAIFALGYVMAR